MVVLVGRDPGVMDELARAQGRWRRKLNGEAFPVLERWLKRSARYESYRAEVFDRAPGLFIAFALARCCVLFLLRSHDFV